MEMAGEEGKGCERDGTMGAGAGGPEWYIDQKNLLVCVEKALVLGLRLGWAKPGSACKEGRGWKRWHPLSSSLLSFFIYMCEKPPPPPTRHSKTFHLAFVEGLDRLGGGKREKNSKGYWAVFARTGWLLAEDIFEIISRSKGRFDPLVLPVAGLTSLRVDQAKLDRHMMAIILQSSGLHLKQSCIHPQIVQERFFQKSSRTYSRSM